MQLRCLFPKPMSGTRKAGTGMAGDTTLCRTKQPVLVSEGILHMKKSKFWFRCIFASFNWMSPAVPWCIYAIFPTACSHLLWVTSWNITWNAPGNEILQSTNRQVINFLYKQKICEYGLFFLEKQMKKSPNGKTWLILHQLWLLILHRKGGRKFNP